MYKLHGVCIINIYIYTYIYLEVIARRGKSHAMIYLSLDSILEIKPC